MEHKLETFKNGLRLITIPLPIQSVTVQISVGAGSRYETASNNGISHFLEHMLFKGTKKRPTAFDISSTIDSIGGKLNASTDKELTSFYVQVAAKHLPLAIDLLTDILTNSLFDPSEIEKEKGVVIEEINMHEDMPIAKIGEVFDALLYDKTPLGRRIIGEKKNIRKMQRTDLLAYMKRFYRPERMVVSIAGASQGDTSGGIGERLDNLAPLTFNQSVRRSSLPKYPISPLKRFTFTQTQPQLKLHYKKTEQAHFCLGVRTFKRDNPDRYTLSVLATILGGNMSSRLFTEVREKRGLAYYIRTSTSRFHETGDLMTQAGTDLKRIGEAIKVVLEEYQKVQSSKFKVQSGELKKAKEYLKGQLVLGLENSHFVASLYAENELLEKKIRTPEEIIKGIDRVTVEDVSRVAKTIFLPKNLNLAIIGPYKEEARFSKILNTF